MAYATDAHGGYEGAAGLIAVKCHVEEGSCGGACGVCHEGIRIGWYDFESRSMGGWLSPDAVQRFTEMFDTPPIMK